MCVCLSVTPQKPRFPMDYRPLVEGHIANIGISLDLFEFCALDDFFRFSKNLDFWVFSVHPTVHLLDMIQRGGSVAVLVMTGDR